MIDHEQHLVSLDELRSTLDAYSGPPELRKRPKRRRTRHLLLGAIALAALAGAGAGIADGLGAFNGIGAAQHAPTAADLLDATTRAGLQNACPDAGGHASFYMPLCHLQLDSTRLVGQVQPYGNLYVVADTRGDLCAVLEGGDSSCGPPLSRSQPITFGSFYRSSTTDGTYIATGLAIDGVTAVSFTLGGKTVEVPVTSNVWVYSEPRSHWTDGHCIRAHFVDGKTADPFPKVPCP
jgi:hypothetical protein